MKVYSDGVVLVRSLGFAFAGAVLGAAFWIGISKAIGFDVPFLFCPLAGFLCGVRGEAGEPGPARGNLLVNSLCVLRHQLRGWQGGDDLRDWSKHLQHHQPAHQWNWTGHWGISRLEVRWRL